MFQLRATLLSKPFREQSLIPVLLVLTLMLGASVLNWSGQGEWMVASKASLLHPGQLYQAFTTSFVHGDLRHLLGNSIFFFIFGFLLHSYFGALWFPGLSLIAGGIINLITLSMMPEHSQLVGASGIVYFMAGAWATLFACIERKKSLPQRLLATIGVSFMLFFPESYEAQTSYLAHGVGFAVGISTALIYFAFAREKIRAQERYEWVPSERDENAQTEVQASAPLYPDETDTKLDPSESSESRCSEQCSSH